jgi:ribonucleoside-diphosphate reductase alpha chain
MIDLRRPSPFIELAAVEAWDAWFRWRDGNHLRDLSIEDTWRRIAGALAAAEPPGERDALRAQVTDALAAWRLLPDERLLADAGTGRIGWRTGVLRASLNAATFVSTDRTVATVIDLASLADCAALAVRALDNAALLAGNPVPQVRVGILGIADALALLGLPYDSDAGRTRAAAMVRALAEGCFRGNVMLAAARGARAEASRVGIARGRSRGIPPGLLRMAARHGLRHLRLVAIVPQPRLALLANDVADAADPLHGWDHACVIAAADGLRDLRSPGYALNILHASGEYSAGAPQTLADLPGAAQIAMRAALQPWLDEPIDYPLLALHPPDATQRASPVR